MGRVLAIDYGTKRHGIALSDGLRLTARPLLTLERPATRAEEFRLIGDILRREEVDLLVVGLPFNMDGTPGTHAPEILRWAEALTEAVGLDVVLQDERLTTVQATHHLRDAGRNRREIKARVDAVAAAVLLQDFLEALASGARTELLPPGDDEE